MAPTERSTALVTGAGSKDGIGFASAVRFGRTGHHVAIVATGGHVHDRAAELQAMGFAASGHVADLREEDAVDALVAELVAASLRVDVLVNNAGMTSQHAGSDAAARLEELSLAAWRDTVQ